MVAAQTHKWELIVYTDASKHEVARVLPFETMRDMALAVGSPVVQDYRKKWAKPSLTTPDRSCMVRIGPDFVRIDPDFVRIDPDHAGSILQ
jgi:hypothetical protein